MRAVVRVDGRHAYGVGVSPVHAGLLAAAYDQYAHDRLDMARADVVAVSPQPAIAHVVLALLEVEQMGQRLLGRLQLLRVEPPEAPGHASRANPVEQPAADAELLRGWLFAQAQRQPTAMLAGLDEGVDVAGFCLGVEKPGLRRRFRMRNSSDCRSAASGPPLARDPGGALDAEEIFLRRHFFVAPYN